MCGRVENKKLEINEYRELLLKTGLAPKTVDRYIAEIDGFVFLYGDNFSWENIEEYAESVMSYSQRKMRRRAVEMFKGWIIRGIKPQRLKRSVYDKAKEESTKEAAPKEIPTVCQYWDNMYNKPAFYKDSHSAQWC